jgi:hypothetical protein
LVGACDAVGWLTMTEPDEQQFSEVLAYEKFLNELNTCANNWYLALQRMTSNRSIVLTHDDANSNNNNNY